MSTPRIIREAEDILRNFGAPPWQGECSHVCLHATLSSRKRGGGSCCCRCDVVVR